MGGALLRCPSSPFGRATARWAQDVWQVFEGCIKKLVPCRWKKMGHGTRLPFVVHEAWVAWVLVSQAMTSISYPCAKMGCIREGLHPAHPCGYQNWPHRE